MRELKKTEKEKKNVLNIIDNEEEMKKRKEN